MLIPKQTDKRFDTNIGGYNFDIRIYDIESSNPEVVIYNSNNKGIQFHGKVSELYQLGEVIKEILKISKV